MNPKDCLHNASSLNWPSPNKEGDIFKTKTIYPMLILRGYALDFWIFPPRLDIKENDPSCRKAGFRVRWLITGKTIPSTATQYRPSRDRLVEQDEEKVNYGQRPSLPMDKLTAKKWKEKKNPWKTSVFAKNYSEAKTRNRRCLSKRQETLWQMTAKMR